MALKVKVKLNKEGIEELLKSSGVQGALSKEARKIASAANQNAEEPGAYYRASAPYVGKTRANCSVWTGNDQAAKDNLQHNTLLNSMGVFSADGRHVDI